MSLHHPSRKLKFHSQKRLNQRDVDRGRCGQLWLWLTDWRRVYILTERDPLPTASFPQSSHSQTLPQECKSPSVCLNTSCNHCGLTALQTCCTPLPWDLSLSGSRKFASLYPVDLLLLESQISFFIYSLVWAVHTTEASWERIHRKQFFWDFTCLKKPFFSFILDESMGGGLLTIGLFHEMFHWTH